MQTIAIANTTVSLYLNTDAQVGYAALLQALNNTATTIHADGGEYLNGVSDGVITIEDRQYTALLTKSAESTWELTVWAANDEQDRAKHFTASAFTIPYHFYEPEDDGGGI